jgi:hypothetical protein
VFNHAGIFADPDLDDAEFAEMVGSPEAEADHVGVAAEGGESAVLDCVLVNAPWEEADLVEVFSCGGAAEE